LNLFATSPAPAGARDDARRLYRLLVRREGASVPLFTRKANTWTERITRSISSTGRALIVVSAPIPTPVRRSSEQPTEPSQPRRSLPDIFRYLGKWRRGRQRHIARLIWTGRLRTCEPSRRCSVDRVPPPSDRAKFEIEPEHDADRLDVFGHDGELLADAVVRGWVGSCVITTQEAA
jgi:hypothetical protein